MTVINIPETGLDAAAVAVGRFLSERCVSDVDAYELAEAAVRAAAPHIRLVEVKQLVEGIPGQADGPFIIAVLLRRIAELEAVVRNG